MTKLRLLIFFRCNISFAPIRACPGDAICPIRFRIRRGTSPCMLFSKLTWKKWLGEISRAIPQWVASSNYVSCSTCDALAILGGHTGPRNRKFRTSKKELCRISLDVCDVVEKTGRPLLWIFLPEIGNRYVHCRFRDNCKFIVVPINGSLYVMGFISSTLSSCRF